MSHYEPDVIRIPVDEVVGLLRSEAIAGLIAEATPLAPSAAPVRLVTDTNLVASALLWSSVFTRHHRNTVSTTAQSSGAPP